MTAMTVTPEHLKNKRTTTVRQKYQNVFTRGRKYYFLNASSGSFGWRKMSGLASLFEVAFMSPVAINHRIIKTSSHL